MARYLTLSADYDGLSLRDPSGELATPEALRVDASLAKALSAWANAYQVVIPASPGERAEEPLRSRITALDAQGLDLAAQLQRSLPSGSKVAYFSEGLGLVIGIFPSPPDSDDLTDVVFRVDDVRLWLDSDGGITLRAVTREGDPVELHAVQAREIAAILLRLAEADER